MNELSEKRSGQALAIIVDLDETLCTCFDVPVMAGVRVLRQIDEGKLQVHYVTARTTVCRLATEKFMEENRLPGAHNVHYCPAKTRSCDHKHNLHRSLGREFRVIASIGDSVEEEQAAKAAGIPFVIVDSSRPTEAWTILADRVASVAGCFSTLV